MKAKVIAIVYTVCLCWEVSLTHEECVLDLSTNFKEAAILLSISDYKSHKFSIYFSNLKIIAK